ncbi:Hypothetical predicted protein [Pelobates cultripes]|uniref:Uncharacterized protein n=1 Tax=Pelobates cultripes TaxID=61616 RepID=A0AAD1SEM7_PELCU|nr:Hypothetical predicted protein [Pelobates cultripes]
MDIKSHVASELDKRLTGLREDIEALAHRSDQAETRITSLSTTSQAHSQDIAYLHAKIEELEESLEDLNNRSRQNNIRIRGLPEAVMPDDLPATLTGLFQTIIPDASEQ